MRVAKNSLEVHYYFRENDDGHLFDVRKRNRCEHALVQIIAEVARVLDVRVKVEALPPREGGFVERIIFSNRLRATAVWMPLKRVSQGGAGRIFLCECGGRCRGGCAADR